MGSKLDLGQHIYDQCLPIFIASCSSSHAMDPTSSVVSPSIQRLRPACVVAVSVKGTVPSIIGAVPVAAKAPTETQVAGYVERLEIVGLGPYRAKFDTGNGTKASMFHVDKLEIKGKIAKWERDGKKFTSNIVGVSHPMHVDKIDKRPIILVDLKFNNKLYKDVPLGLTTRDSRSTFLVNRELLTRLKVAVNPDRKFVLSSYIERGDDNDEDYRTPR